MTGDVIGAVVTSVCLVGLLAWGLRPIGDRSLFRWSGRFGLEISRGGREMVIQELERGKRLRWCAAVFGMTISALPVYVNLFAADHAADFAGPGYGLVWIGAAALGSTLAEAIVRQRPHDSMALLERRRWTDFVSTHPARWTLAATGLGVMGATLALVRHTEHAGTAIGAAVGGLVSVALVVVGLRRIVDRPRLALAGEARALDDAMRADGAHHIVGAALALSTSCASVAIVEGTWSVFPFIALVMAPLQYVALSNWWSLSTLSPWRVTTEQHVTA